MLEHNSKKKSDNRSNLIVLLVVVILALSLDIVLSTTAIYPYLVYAQVQNITKQGTFNYTQTDTSGNPDWINTGNWSLKKSPSEVIAFDAVISMAKPNGSEEHIHRVGDLTISYAPIKQTNSTIIKGTTTITMENGFFVSEEPTTIKLGERNISVYFDTSKINNHFGNHSITGMVTQ
ncbi:MAG: hypothetical protein AB7V56_16785 [Candidatus Nitrosocosmicus sp.]